MLRTKKQLKRGGGKMKAKVTEAFWCRRAEMRAQQERVSDGWMMAGQVS